MLVGAAIAAQSALTDDSAPPRDGAHSTGFAGCRQALSRSPAEAGQQPDPGSDQAVLPPLVLLGARSAANGDPDGLGGHGYELPAVLPRRARAILSVPRALRDEVGLAFTQHIIRRATRDGVPSANAKIVFSACPRPVERSEEEGIARTTWEGGIVVDHPRCVLLELRLKGEDPVLSRVPLGRACRLPLRIVGALPGG